MLFTSIGIEGLEKMIGKTAVDLLRGKIAELEAIRDALLPLASGQDINPIFDQIEEYYRQLLGVIGYDPTSVDEPDRSNGVG